MKAVHLIAPGLDGVALVEVPDLSPGPGEVLMRMKAASLNARDVGVASGKLGTKLPRVPLSDGVGVVEAVGEGVTTLKPGDRVSPIYAPRWLSGPPTDAAAAPALGGDLDGVLRQQMVAQAQSVVLVPEHLSDAEAATLTVAGVTAWSALVNFGKVKPGDTVLIEGTGGVALFALQFAKLAGARVAVVSSSGEKLERAKALGADILVNYSDTPDWGPAVRAATGGVDIVVETVGAETLAKAMATLNRGARVAQVGLMSGVAATLPLQLLIPRSISIQGILVGGRDAFEAMNKAIAMHSLRPVIGETFAFDQLTQALNRIAGKGHFGKIVIDIQ